MMLILLYAASRSPPRRDPTRPTPLSAAAAPLRATARSLPMIRRLLARLHSRRGQGARDPRVYGPDDHPVRRDQLVQRRQPGHPPAAGGGLQGLRRRRRRPRPAARHRAQGLRHRDRRRARAGQAAVPPRLPHRPPVPAGPRPRRRGDDRGVDVPRAAEATTPTDEHGRLLSDNVYGTQAEDAARRDFTINALYFDPATEDVWDYVGGVADIRARRLKLIGPPTTRYREDPVRMLRAVRLAAKLGIAIEPKTAAPISEARPADRQRPAGARCSTRCRSCCCPATPPSRCRACARTACRTASCRCST